MPFEEGASEHLRRTASCKQAGSFIFSLRKLRMTRTRQAVPHLWQARKSPTCPLYHQPGMMSMTLKRMQANPTPNQMKSRPRTARLLSTRVPRTRIPHRLSRILCRSAHPNRQRNSPPPALSNPVVFEAAFLVGDDRPRNSRTASRNVKVCAIAARTSTAQILVAAASMVPIHPAKKAKTPRARWRLRGAARIVRVALARMSAAEQRHFSLVPVFK